MYKSDSKLNFAFKNMQDPLRQKNRALHNKLCCVPKCTQSKWRNEELRLYSFPNREWEKERKKIWISRVRKEPGWMPTKYTKICSAHFIDGIKSQDPRKENYYPSIFPWKKEKESAVKRRKRLADRIKRRMESSSTNNDAEVIGVAPSIKPNVPKKFLKKFHGISTQTEMQTDNYNHEELQNVPLLFCWQDSSRNEASTQTFIPAFKNSKSSSQNCVKSLNSLEGTCNFRRKCLESIKIHKAYVRESKQGNEYFKFRPVSVADILNKRKDKSSKDIQNLEEIKLESNVDLIIKYKLPEMSNKLKMDEHVKKEINEELVIKAELQEDPLFANEIPNSSNIPNVRNEEKEVEYILPDESIETERKSKSNVHGRIKSELPEKVNAKMFDKLEVDVNKEINEELVIKEKLEDVLFVKEIPNSLKTTYTGNEKRKDEYILPDDLTESESQSTHPDIGPSVGTSSIDAYLRPYKCNICRRTFKQSSEMKRHYRFHSGEPHICKICHRSFTEFSNLKVHYRIHNGDKPFSCSVCPKKFVSSSNLRHHELVHINDKPYSCEICHKSFKHSLYMRRHMSTHTGKRPFTCDICHKSFTQSSSLKKHRQTHSGDKPFSCPVCQKKFAVSSYLRQHEAIHSETKPYSCEICQRSFTYKSNMRVHKCIRTDTKTHK